ncbi:MAG: indolepyruvate oxidoreductase subunit beta [Desulfitobacteriaceae bacterium]|nr:indolepyruvate oxidoreductase subunit beta [Desulfitobacteriaceae bacterium]
MFQEPINIVITGVGGQGNVLAAQVIAVSAVEAGYLVSSGETSGLAQRGGPVMTHVRVFCRQNYGPLVPHGRATVVIGFEPLETMRVLFDYGNRGTVVISNDRPSYPLGCLQCEDSYPEVSLIKDGIKNMVQQSFFIPASELAAQAGTSLAANMVMTGCLAGTGLLPFGKEFFRSTIDKLFPNKLKELNLKAFELGFDQVFQQVV